MKKKQNSWKDQDMAISAFYSLHCCTPRLVHHNLPLASSLMLSSFPATHNSRRRRRLLHSKNKPLLSSPSALQQDIQAVEDHEELVYAIDRELASFDIGEENQVPILREALMLVDLIEGLGIQRFFQFQIERIMSLAYKQWDKQFGFKDGEVTFLAFRLLRLHGYHISADVIKKIRDDNGAFSLFLTGTPNRLSGSLNMFKCSQTSFPYESKIMGEMQEISRSELTKAILEENSFQLQNKHIVDEVRFALEYPRRYCLLRMEARRIIKRLWPSNKCKMKCLELAKLDLETIQKLHQQAMDGLEKWWEEQGFKDLQFARRRVLKCFYTISVPMFEPQYLIYCEVFTKLACLVTTIDDLFDLPTSDVEGLSRFNEVVQRWDPSPVEGLPQHKVVFTSLHRNITEIATLASKAQGRDLFPYIKSLWEDLIDTFITEAGWRHSGHVPALKDYLDVACISFATPACLLTSIFFLGEPITDEVMRHVGKGSRIIHLASLSSRLANDIATSEREATLGELATAVGCYMRENPGCTREEAVAALDSVIEGNCMELELEVYKCRVAGVPECCVRTLLSWSQSTCLIYKRGDGYTCTSDGEFEELIKDYVYGSF